MLTNGMEDRIQNEFPTPHQRCANKIAVSSEPRFKTLSIVQAATCLCCWVAATSVCQSMWLDWIDLIGKISFEALSIFLSLITAECIRMHATTLCMPLLCKERSYGDLPVNRLGYGRLHRVHCWQCAMQKNMFVHTYTGDLASIV